jgi:hypothetical protein
MSLHCALHVPPTMISRYYGPISFCLASISPLIYKMFSQRICKSEVGKDAKGYFIASVSSKDNYGPSSYMREAYPDMSIEISNTSTTSFDYTVGAFSWDRNAPYEWSRYPKDLLTAYYPLDVLATKECANFVYGSSYYDLSSGDFTRYFSGINLMSNLILNEIQPSNTKIIVGAMASLPEVSASAII